MLICWATRYARGMTDEFVTTKKARTRGYGARVIGGLLMVLGVVASVAAGSFSALAAILFFGGLLALIVGGVLKDRT